MIKFIRDREKCLAKFILPKHKSFRDEYFKIFNKLQLEDLKQKLYYPYLKKNGIWNSICNMVSNAWDCSYIQVSKETRTWETYDENFIISKYPPVGNINYGNIAATAFVKINDHKKVSLENIFVIIKQNNYTHLHLQFIVSHLSQLEDRWLPRDKGKSKILDEIKPVLIKPPVTMTKNLILLLLLKKSSSKN